MSRLTVCLFALLALNLAGCSSSESSEADLNNERTVGDPAVIARIESSTSCPDLYRERLNAATNAIRVHREGGDASVPLTYQSVASLRLLELGC